MAMTSVATIDERLASAEDELLHAAAIGGAALDKFHDSWATLLVDMEYEAQISKVTEDIMRTRNATATRLLLLSEQLLAFQVAADDMSSKLDDELEALFARVNVSDTFHDNTPHRKQKELYLPPSPSPSAHNELAAVEHLPRAGPSCPPYIKLAYQWLLNNLHNPYPTKAIKDAISIDTGCNRASIDAWFIDVRKRIGWNHLRKQRFSNKRVEIVDAATRFFVQPDPTRILDPSIGPKFAAIEVAANDLYSGRFNNSVLATRLDSAVKDMTPELKFQMGVKADVGRRRQEPKDRALKDAQAVASYPSPNHSPNSLTPHTLSDEMPLSAVHPIASMGRKRPISSQDLHIWGSDLSTESPNKRCRLSTSDIEATSSLPSPALSLNSLPPHTPPPDPASAIPKTRRKRRLSDAGSEGTVKRPRNNLSGPRLHAVSDPLPSSTFSTWFESHFGIPSTPDYNSFASLDVEFYDYSRQEISELGDTVTNTSEELGSLLSFDEPQLLNVSSSELDTSTGDFDTLFCESGDSESGSFLRQMPNQPGELTFSPFDLPVAGHNPTPNSTNPTTIFPDTAVIVDTAAHMQHFETEFDWIFPPLISSQDLLHPFKDCEDGAVSSLMIWQEKEFEKAVKKRKLVEMKEATRRLEAEIAAS